jgi:hypothetical protein
MSDSEYSDDEDTGYANARDAWQNQNTQALQPNVIDAIESSLNGTNQLKPTLLQFQQYQIVQVITLDSTHRDQQAYPNPLSCRLYLPKIYKNISRIDIIQIKMACGLYALSAARGNTTLILFDRNERRISVTVPDGTYTASALSSTLTSLLNAASTPTIYKVSFNATIGRFVLTSPGNPFRLPFLTTRADPTQKVYTDWGLGYSMGFGGAPQDLGRSETHTATMLPRLNTDYIYLKLNETDSMNTVDTSGPEDFAVSQDTNGITGAYFGKLLMNDFGSYAQTFIEAPKIFHNPLSRLDRLSFDWTLKDGTAIAGPDALSCDWHMTLRIYQITDGPTDSSTLIRSL